MECGSKELIKAQERSRNLLYELEQIKSDFDDVKEIAKFGVIDYNKELERFYLCSNAMKILRLENHIFTPLEIVERLSLDKKSIRFLQNDSIEEIEKKSIVVELKIDKEIKFLKIYAKDFRKNSKNLVRFVVFDITEEEIKKREESEREQLLIQQSKVLIAGETVSNVAHHWRQPLNLLSLLCYSMYEETQDGTLSKENSTKYYNEISNTLQNLSKVIDNFRNFFKPENKKRSFELDSVIEKVTSLLGGTLRENHIAYNIIKDSQSIMIFGYENELSQVLLNIINNARDEIIQNGIKNGKIDLRIYKNSNSVIIEIEDNGGGIENDNLSKVFNPYFTTKKDSSGIGIALYVSKILVEKSMNGKLFASNGERGAIFKITLPITQG